MYKSGKVNRREARQAAGFMPAGAAAGVSAEPAGGVWDWARNPRALIAAIVRKKVGKGEAICIGSSLEAVYEETRMKRLRTCFDTLVAPWLADERRYRMDYQSGVMPHFMASGDTLVLHLLADTGNKNKHLRARGEFVPVAVRVAVKIPKGRSVPSATLLRAGTKLNITPRDGWLEVAIPRVLIHEAVEINLI